MTGRVVAPRLVGPAVDGGREWLPAGWRHVVPAARGEAVVVAVRRGIGVGVDRTADRPVLLRVVRSAAAGVSAGLWLPADAARETSLQLARAVEYVEERHEPAPGGGLR